MRFAGQGQQQYTIGGSEMVPLEGSKSSMPGSTSRKGSTTSDVYYKEIEDDK